MAKSDKVCYSETQIIGIGGALRMKTIGLIGGMSWESTVTYYQVLNETVKKRLGGFHSAKLLMYSVDFAELEQCMVSDRWDDAADILAQAAIRLERGGADFVLICTNTLHKVAPQVQRAVGIPLLHIAEATAQALCTAGISKAALLGTKYTMTQDFYKDKLLAAGIEALIPGEDDVEVLNHIIFDELCLGVVSPASRAELVRMISELKSKGAQGVIFGCTELGLILSAQDSPLPVFDTTLIHAAKAAELALG